MTPARLLAGLLPFLTALLPIASTAADGPIPIAELSKPGRVLMLRHAFAPGGGDPPGFRISDCATQRNLNDDGRAQARRIGERLRAAGIHAARVWSSQWCRCLETSRLMDVGTVHELPALNSFFGQPSLGDRQVASLRAFLAKLPMEGPPVILVTHQVMVTAHTGHWVESGGGAVFAREPGGTLRHLGAASLD